MQCTVHCNVDTTLLNKLFVPTTDNFSDRISRRKLADIFQTTIKFPDISTLFRFSRQAVALQARSKKLAFLATDIARNAEHQVMHRSYGESVAVGACEFTSAAGGRRSMNFNLKSTWLLTQMTLTAVHNSVGSTRWTRTAARVHNNTVISVAVDDRINTAQLPLREQSVSLVHSSHHNATLGYLTFLGVYLYVTPGIFSKNAWQRTHASLRE